VIGVAELEKGRDDLGQRRGERVIAKLQTDHLNSEEKKSLREPCFAYQDVLFLPGGKLSCTNVARHTIQLEPGVTPINTPLYRLSDSQNEEGDQQGKQLHEDRIIAKSDSPWNSPLLLVPRKVGPDGKIKWYLVVDFVKRMRKLLGVLTPYLILQKYWTSWVSLNILRD